MNLDERFLIDAPLDIAWRHLQDPAFVAGCLPGVELGGETGDGYNGQISVKFGPTVVVFTGRAEFSFDDASRTATINARGSDKRGSTKANALVDVAVGSEEGRTGVRVSGKVDLVGPLSSFASTGGVYVAKALLADFADCVSATLSVDSGDSRAVDNGAQPVSAGRMFWKSIAAAFEALWSRVFRRPRN